MKTLIPYLKKRLLSILILVVFSAGIVLQSKAQISYGLKLGAGVACQSDLLELANNCDVRFSPSFGITGKYRIKSGFAIKSGLLYQQKGRNFTEENVEIENKLQYVTLPLQAEFSAGEKAGFKKGQRLYFAIGPYLSYMLNAEGQLDDIILDLNNDTKNFDAGLGLELGIEFPAFNNKALQVGLNYDMGFVEVYKSTPDLHNKMAALSLALTF